MDYSILKIGDFDPSLGRKIKEIIFSSDSFIVYIDTEDIICWATDHHKVFGENFGNISNQISNWESLCNRLFSKQDSYDYKCLLAEGYARMLDEGNDQMAQKIIDQTAERIKQQGMQILRQDYLISSLISTCLVVLFLFLSVIFKKLIFQFVDRSIYEILLTSYFGGLGAFISTMIRARNYNAEISSSRRIHRIDGVLRIIYGLIAGVMISLGVKANILFGFLNSVDKNIYVLSFLGAIGGASEMLLPNIIRQFDDKAVENGKQKV